MTSAELSGESQQLRQEAIYSAGSRRTVATAVRELWHYREVVWSFTARNLRVRYKEAVLGVAWIVIQPLMIFLPFVIFFGHLVKISGDGVPYAAFAGSVLIPWQLVSSGVGTGSNSLVAEGALLRKVYFPREAPVVAAIGAALCDFTIGLVVAVPTVWLLGGHPGFALLWIPVLTVLLLVPVTALALGLSALNVYFRDVRYALPALIQLFLYSSPVSFPATKIPAKYRTLYAFLDPFVGPLDGFRRAISKGQSPSFVLTAASFATGLLLLLGAIRYFARLESEFGDLT